MLVVVLSVDVKTRKVPTCNIKYSQNVLQTILLRPIFTFWFLFLSIDSILSEISAAKKHSNAICIDSSISGARTSAIRFVLHLCVGYLNGSIGTDGPLPRGKR